MGTNTYETRGNVRIMLATEEPLLALGATCLLASAGDFEVVGSPVGYTDLVPAVARESPDVLLIDLAPEITPALFAVARKAAPNCRLALWARAITDELTYQASQSGVAGFVRRTASNEEFLNVLRRIARGASELDRPAPRQQYTAVRLTPRESQIVALLAQGLSNKEIATCLDLSEGTVKSYLVHLFRKVGARDRFELALLGLKNTFCGEAFWDGQGAFVSKPDPNRARPLLRSLVMVQPDRRRGGYPDEKSKAAGAVE